MLINIREAILKTGMEGRVGIMLDIKGPEIRTGFLESRTSLSLKEGQTLKITGDYSVKGNQDVLAVSYPKVVKSLQPGQKILIENGKLSLEVKEVLDNVLVTTVLNDHVLGERKKVNLPGVKVDLPAITDKDYNDIVNFGLKYGVDFVALSLTRTKECVTSCRKIVEASRQDIQIISKIENQEGLVNLEEIIDCSDGLMMARGDLGMELDPSKLLIAQKYITKKCRSMGKPVICASQMLESMTKNSRPTRAEMSDVGNAVLDSVDSVMLSGETREGIFVEESASIMANICREMEGAFNYYNHYKLYKKNNKLYNKAIQENRVYIMAKSCVKLSFQIKSKAIIVIDESGELALQISRLRPKAFIIYPSTNPRKLSKMTLNFGIIGVLSRSGNLTNDAKSFILSHKIDEFKKNVVFADSHQNKIQMTTLF
jgi:pyruvate kinase